MTCSPNVITFEVEKPGAAALEREYAIAIDLIEREVITIGEQGPPGVGIPGPAGGSAVQRLAGETLSALMAVYELDGLVFRLDQADGEHIALLLGITLTAADTGATLNIQRTGVIDDAAWFWATGRVWLGADGALTQVPPTQGFNLLIGAAVSPTRLILNLQDPIDLE
jgi:hypothetical protein